ncbi:MAG: DUF3311 domain-containing protein [Planctomycetaceae bacterium]
MKSVVWILIAALIVLHQDVWFWEDDRLAFGFLPVGLAYHVGLSLACVVTWFLATRYAWPVEDGDENSAGTDA